MRSIAEIIQSRRSIKKATEEPISKETVLHLIEIASFAPFHSKVEPWEVYMMSTGAQKEKYVEAVVKANCEKQEEEQKIRESTMAKIGTAPITLIITSKIVGNEKKDFEAIAATSAFIQNLQLLGWEENIGMIWRTNKYIFSPLFCEALGIPSDEKIIGTLHLTRFTEVKEAKTRREITSYVHEL
ncbi:nitroreductase [Listeria fleischmannii 1991]|uniref:NAD(P)H nitroreductase ydjA n=2 Tax=Listeria fleischmannii TaxID=1069827 RepID=A0A2X3HI37_9LIST|nr:nitroreductase [Listeria fleischmannii]EMG29337.1 nitroreductase [Listeria fleischmannii subsp. fleischmannii LU2006-1]KMT59130.1 nitroreductase [Listeria fleischmannii 1991]SQC72233.1 Putative NAD(P)H nitroreductase ydjA [Listeria fleischmannii subsp. fleischmannii]